MQHGLARLVRDEGFASDLCPLPPPSLPSVPVARDLEGGNPEEKKALGKHQVLAYASASKDERTKRYKQHVKELMSKGASRLTGGKRVRLTSDEGEEEKYELNVLTEYIDGDPNLALVFFAITSVDFGKHQSISGLFKDFKEGVYTEFPSDTLATAQSSGPVHATMKRFFESLFAKYNKSQLINVARKVDQVKDVMKENVNKALNNVEHLEEVRQSNQAHRLSWPRLALACEREGNMLLGGEARRLIQRPRSLGLY